MSENQKTLLSLFVTFIGLPAFVYFLSEGNYIAIGILVLVFILGGLAFLSEMHEIGGGVLVTGIILAIGGVFIWGNYGPKTFKGYACTDDCSGHKAGYEWAERKSINDVAICEDVKSQSFTEGCVAFVKEYNR